MTHRDTLTPSVGGLGRKIERPKPEQPEWVPTAKYGIERNLKTGKLRTNDPRNGTAVIALDAPVPRPFIWPWGFKFPKF
jgi:hypothetical protein